METLRELNWVDLAIIVVLAIGVFAGFMAGMISYVLNALVVVIAFIVAAQLKGPILDLLGFWRAFSPEGRELIVFAVLFFGLTIAGWFVVRRAYRRTRLPVAKQIDEIGGAIFGLIFAALLISLQLIVFDSFFTNTDETGGWLGGYYDALNTSFIVGFFRDTIIPVIGFVARPFVPAEIARLLLP